MDSIVLIGAGGHAKVVIDIIESTGKFRIAGITDKSKTGSILGIPIIGNDEELEKLFKRGINYAFICVGSIHDLQVREDLYKRAKEIGYKFPVLLHQKAVVSRFSQIGEGVCIMAGAIINAGAIIGDNCIINTGSIIEHDCVIGSNTHISPRAVLAGGVKIGSNTHIGLGSSIIEGKQIGMNVTVGAGAVVIKDIDDNAIAVGVPAKTLRMKI